MPNALKSTLNARRNVVHLKDLQLAFASHDQTWFGVLVDDQGRLIASAFSSDKQAVKNHLVNYSRKIVGISPRDAPHMAADQMVELFNSEDTTSRVSLNPIGVSEFRRRVYKVLKRIPRGRVTNYGMIARAIRSGPRAVGNAVGSNPWPLFVPCHRVVPKSMTVGNYSMIGNEGHSGPLVKKTLLEREGIEFQRDKIPETAIWNPR